MKIFRLFNILLGTAFAGKNQERDEILLDIFTFTVVTNYLSTQISLKYLKFLFSDRSLASLNLFSEI
jgi:hypothetical protein